ncbi:DUF4767 domain-containing protein [Xylocopilactobacillus apis]|uniref:DUF4767 domain-containing protein n=1 Tax=Xylocopilactobacillus apis TaxID=2932183 RepID=A0AAU9CZA9_9LACO|nr:DUF4767 domain-containing protein [Xylocopilactobacillus apis]BDR56593.1 hypothetical protein KIMC2_11550 [Xylocopilactobacillus apis]
MFKNKRFLFTILILMSASTMAGCSTKSSSESKKSDAETSSVKKKAHSKSKKAQDTKNKDLHKSSSVAANSSSNTNQTTTTNKSESNTSSNSTTNQTTAKKPTASWSQEKNQKLSAFMKQWQTKMGQSYQGTYDGKIADHYGYKFPQTVTSGQINGHVDIDDRPVNLTWSTNGNNGAEYQIVAAATKDSQNMDRITYLFAIHNGTPEAYYTKTTNGDIVYFLTTRMQNLKKDSKI